MLPPIPKLEDYSISYRNGFLPDHLPLRRLPDRYYEPWEDIIDNLQPLILTKRIRTSVKRLPLLSISRLRSEAELQRAYSILGFMSHSFIWGGDQPADVSHTFYLFSLLPGTLQFLGNQKISDITVSSRRIATPSMHLRSVPTHLRAPGNIPCGYLCWRDAVEL